MSSQVVQTIASQIKAQGVKPSALIAWDEKTLKIVLPGNKHVFISYDQNVDLYDVNVYKYNREKMELLFDKEIQGVYADQLAGCI